MEENDEEDEIALKLKEAICGVLGEYTPYVIAYDAASIDPSEDGKLEVCDNPHQRYYVTEGLLHSALALISQSQWYENGDSEED